MSLDAGQCAQFYQDLGLRSVSLVALKLEEYAKASAKRCKEKHLDEANHELEGTEQALEHLSEEHFLPLLSCILACQMDSCNSSSLFLRLEKLVLKMSQIRPCLVRQQRKRLLITILENKEVLHVRDLQAVCMYLEGSQSGRTYFTQHLPALLTKVSGTLSAVVQDHVSQGSEHPHLAVKLCLQLFREVAERISPFIWGSACVPNPLESILESLLCIITNQKFSRDVRLLAGTAVASLANTGPVVESAAQAAMNLIQQMTSGHGDVQFEMLHVSLPHPSVDELGLLALLRGLLTCGREDLLTSVLPSPSQNLTMLEHLLPAIASLCEGHTEQYYSFQVFCLWLQCVCKQTSTLHKVSGKLLLTDQTDTTSVVIRLLWVGAEIQVDGMAALMLSCFQHFLHINHVECQLSALSEETMLQDVMQKIREIPWQARSRYPPLCALMPLLGSKKTLALYPLLPGHLFYCLATNYLCPPAADTYRTLITIQREEWIQDGLANEGELAKHWAQFWLLPLSNALSSTDCSLQSNTATHLLPCTLRTFAESFNLLAKQLDGCGPLQLRAWISIVRTKKAITGGVTGVEEKLQLCLESADEGVRLSALIFLCCSPRTNQSPSLEELQLLKKYLPFNMGCDSPGFRQQLQAAVRRALERLRDAAMSSLRRGQTNRENVSQTIDFTEWLFQLSISSLSPAGNYQRRCSALLSLCSLLECCTDCWSPEKKKGQPPQDLSLLLQYAQQRGCWNFLSAHSMHALLGCMQDSTNEIREMAADLLVRFFLPTPASVTISLFELGQKYLCSPRVPMAEAGALLIKTLLQRPDASLLLSEHVPLSALGLVMHLTKMLQNHYCCAQGNLLGAASAKPMQGVLCALRLCLLEVPSVSLSLSQAELASTWCSLLLELLGLLQEITSFILGMLHKRWTDEPTGIAAPSLEDMGNAVRALIAHGKGQEEVQGDILLSEEHSLIMTCFWVSLKEIGMFLGPLVEKLISGSAPSIPFSAVQSSMAAYHDIFIKCRHWGAVDGCSAGFTKLCSALLRHKDPKLRDLPKEMMEQALLVVQSRTSLSVTRRAAGFPLLLQCILSAEGSQHPLLESCVLSLLTLAKKPLPTNWDQTRDLPQVTAVHALQSMLRSASLRSTLLNHAVPMMSLALISLSSPCWAMRNAALQLFTALTVGMLELSRSDTDSNLQSTLHVGALLRRFPGLLDVLLRELHMARNRKKMLHPSLHPILTLLAKLQPGEDTDASCLIGPLLELRENPIYAVRIIAARALVPVVQQKDCWNLLLQLILDLPRRNEGVSHNALHGQLQNIYALLSSVPKGNFILEDARQEVSQHLLSVFWLMSPIQKCPLIRHVFLDVLTLLSPHCGEDFARQVQVAVCKELSAKEPFTQVGAQTYHEACVRYLCNEASSPSGLEASRFVCQLLLDGDTVVLKWLIDQQLGDIPTALGHSLVDILQNTLYQMLGEDHPLKLTMYLESYVHLHRVCPSPPVQYPPHTKSKCANVLLRLLESRKGGPQLQGYALATLSLLLTYEKVLDDLSLVARWLSVLTACADPAISCEKLRLAAADSLQLAGADLVILALKCGTSELVQLAVRAVLCAVNLLQDEDRGVRELTTKFAVSALNRPPEITLHTDWAIVCLLELLRNSFWGYEGTFHALIHHLPTCDLHTVLSSLHDRSLALYEEDEPNMFADPNFLCSLLHPLLYDLMSVMAHTLHSVLLQWVQSTTTIVREQLRGYHSWTNQHGSLCVSWLAASGCSRVHSAILGLLVRGGLILRAHEVLTQVDTRLTLGSLREELVQLQEELELHGLGHCHMKMKMGLYWRHCPSAADLGS
ncbi:PREDICTED: thyroid adenoma-associated protein homolog [Nanorana parkeri]|uniref:thyroid adenoma-associated protein homolog n=1 Tax=Nanorana parkeri TaxID=125878 RepID=UPI0008549D80|nr:PREDICTED: thyroid adenoma-associated protein homolog [Nanorana parkeri]